VLSHGAQQDVSTHSVANTHEAQRDPGPVTASQSSSVAQIGFGEVQKPKDEQKQSGEGTPTQRQPGPQSSPNSQSVQSGHSPY
jgi:hypothetical protein